MKSIWKYPVVPGRFTHAIPEGGKILHLAVQGDAGEPQMWVLVDKSADTESRTFRVYGTGRDMSDEELAYVGTFMQDGGSLVFHVFEEKLPDGDNGSST